MSETEFCRCPEGAYIGAQSINEPVRCERCRLTLDKVANDLLDSIHKVSMERLRRWAKKNPLD